MNIFVVVIFGYKTITSFDNGFTSVSKLVTKTRNNYVCKNKKMATKNDNELSLMKI